MSWFYRWAEEELIECNPFNDVDFNRPLVDAEAIARRKETLPNDPYERELARLQALNELAQELNQAVDVERTLEVTLAKVVEVMDVPTAWIFLLPEVHVRQKRFEARAAHEFALATFWGLPPGLEERERYFLCQPPDCHCQSLLRRGRLTRAVNIVECTRCQDASKAGGDNRGLMFHASAPLIASGRVLGLINVATEEWQFFTAADLRFLSTVSAHGSADSPLMPTGPLLGIFDEVTISKEEVTLAPGDRFVGYTDGVKDAVNGEVEEYGSRRLKRAIDEAHGTADATLNRILEELAAFAGDTGQSDDVTVLIVRRELA